MKNFVIHTLHLLVDTLFPPRATTVRIASLTTDELMLQYRVRVIAKIPHITALLPYHAPIVSCLVQEAKFNGNTYAQKLLGSVLARYIREEIASQVSIALVPVPLSVARRTARGYNQVEHIVRYAYEHLRRDVPIRKIVILPATLERVRETVPQTSLNHIERLQNVRGAFRAAPNFDPAYLYIVIDDVTTTGATLSAALEAFESAGVQCRGVALSQ